MNKMKYEQEYEKLGIRTAPVQKDYTPEKYGLTIKKFSLLERGNLSYDYRSCSETKK